MTLVSELLGSAMALTFVSDSYMYLCVRRELSRANEGFEKYFTGSRWSQWTWMRGYTTLARARGLPFWPVYVHWIAWPAMLALLVVFVYRG